VEFEEILILMRLCVILQINPNEEEEDRMTVSEPPGHLGVTMKQKRKMTRLY